ncbi:transcriptional repressor [Marmoricola endophyticus]|uniref:Transcriptional repressor n=1 Tax=Marmoricola endophyticus TaxID=2040280 RepID=A0A917F2F3_9ACTN|nr:Fur family transcriptional regulator [Marmoricola endophyticus]GGF43766.1 transcriptional repressor [Marmoricola endophyticus]
MADAGDVPVPAPAAHGAAGWKADLRARGYRLTPQRELVLAAVEALGHATPEQVYAEVRRQSEAVNLSTVYRTLELLDELGVIRHAHIESRTPTYHSTSGHEHFHLVCHRCGRVLTASADDVTAFAALLAERYDGFALDVGHLTVFGTCPDCADI